MSRCVPHRSFTRNGKRQRACRPAHRAPRDCCAHDPNATTRVRQPLRTHPPDDAATARNTVTLRQQDARLLTARPAGGRNNKRQRACRPVHRAPCDRCAHDPNVRLGYDGHSRPGYTRSPVPRRRRWRSETPTGRTGAPRTDPTHETARASASAAPSARFVTTAALMTRTLRLGYDSHFRRRSTRPQRGSCRWSPSGTRPRDPTHHRIRTNTKQQEAPCLPSCREP